MLMKSFNLVHVYTCELAGFDQHLIAEHVIVVENIIAFNLNAYNSYI